MQTELQVSLDSMLPLHQESILSQDENPAEPTSSVYNVAAEQPTRKPTRQWAAWTRQEEESFFTALRQVGKNFEKITCRVQSKNKDQVRHYYYRLVRRMNKLLGPGLCLDAKNSKDTNAAMLRWWSLLEKYSCRASKLHLKPRRFKIFVEALESQLLKDRKKNIRKRPSLGENCSFASPNAVSNQSRTSGHDAHSVKLVLVDSQNIQKLGPGKGSFKRNADVRVNRNNSKGELTIMKPERRRRKPGPSLAAHKKWEKAAIAGVSLVADAAEHLERAANSKDVEHDQDRPGQKFVGPIESIQLHLPPSSQNLFVESNLHAAGKLKLQLFPIDESTRRALEMDKHNPHLELTLSSRKKISSVLEHLHRKWGNSNVASGEIMLFPYSVQRENLMNYQRWTQASVVSASDVYAMIGCPSVFRLRYGWFSGSELESLMGQAIVTSSCIQSVDSRNGESRRNHIVEAEPSCVPSADESIKLGDPYKYQIAARKEYNVFESPSSNLPNGTNRDCTMGSKNNLAVSSPVTDSSFQRSSSGANMRGTKEADDHGFGSITALSAGDWADTLTNVSVGDLLSEVPHNVETSCVDPPIAESSECLQQLPFSCDSFDAAIAAHISRHQNMSNLASHAFSIWDAEETCDAFSFQKDPVPYAEVPQKDASINACQQISITSLVRLDSFTKEPDDVEEAADKSVGGDPVDEYPSDAHDLINSAKDFGALTDMYWPDSLGPLDLDIPSSKYHHEDLILCDSLEGLNRLIASSLDAFQNCSFFGLDKKESTTVKACENPSSGFKIGTEV